MKGKHENIIGGNEKTKILGEQIKPCMCLRNEASYGPRNEASHWVRNKHLPGKKKAQSKTIPCCKRSPTSSRQQAKSQATTFLRRRADHMRKQNLGSKHTISPREDQKTR